MSQRYDSRCESQKWVIWQLVISGRTCIKERMLDNEGFDSFFLLFYSGFLRSSYSIDYFKYTELTSELLLSPCDVWLKRTHSWRGIFKSSTLLRYIPDTGEISQLDNAHRISSEIPLDSQLDTSLVFRGILTSLQWVSLENKLASWGSCSKSCRTQLHSLDDQCS